MQDGWRCPACSLILSPSVRSHRCGTPPDDAVPAVTPAPGPPPPACGSGTSGTADLPVITVSVPGPMLTMAGLRREAERGNISMNAFRSALGLGYPPA